jgi:hypothetical protein
MRLRDARCQVRGDQDSEWDLGSEEAGGDARGVFGAGHGDDKFGVGGWRRVVSERVDVDGVGGNAPCLHLLGDFLCVGWGKHADFAGGFEVVGEVVQQSGDGSREAHRGKYTGAKEGVAAKGVEQDVFGAGDI